MWCKEHWVSGDQDPDPVLLLNGTGSDWAIPIHSQASFAPPVLFRVEKQRVYATVALGDLPLFYLSLPLRTSRRGSCLS